MLFAATGLNFNMPNLSGYGAVAKGLGILAVLIFLIAIIFWHIHQMQRR